MRPGLTGEGSSKVGLLRLRKVGDSRGGWKGSGGAVGIVEVRQVQGHQAA